MFQIYVHAFPIAPETHLSHVILRWGLSRGILFRMTQHGQIFFFGPHSVFIDLLVLFLSLAQGISQLATLLQATRDEHEQQKHENETDA
jgi:hypothetical protein